MSDVADRANRIECVQQGLNTYLPLLLTRFEEIEKRREADLKRTEQKLEAHLKANDRTLDDIHKEAQRHSRTIIRTIIMSVVGTGLATAASISFT